MYPLSVFFITAGSIKAKAKMLYNKIIKNFQRRNLNNLEKTKSINVLTIFINENVNINYP